MQVQVRKWIRKHAASMGLTCDEAEEEVTRAALDDSDAEVSHITLSEESTPSPRPSAAVAGTPPLPQCMGCYYKPEPSIPLLHAEPYLHHENMTPHAVAPAVSTVSFCSLGDLQPNDWAAHEAASQLLSLSSPSRSSEAGR